MSKVRSTVAVAAGFAVTAIAASAIDQLFHSTGVFPPYGEAMSGELFILPAAYRTVLGVLGAWVVAALAPRNAGKHVLVYGAIGVVVSLIGAIVTIPMALGPLWYPIYLVLAALPAAWFGGYLQQTAALPRRPFAFE